MNANDRIKQFHLEHGGEHGTDFVSDGGWLYFSDGAMRENNNYGALISPDADLFKRAKIILYYWEKKTALAQEEFRTYTQQCLDMARAQAAMQNIPCHFDIEEAKAGQVKLKKKYQATFVKLQKAREELEKHRPQQFKRREQIMKENSLKLSQFEDALSEINI